jgi:peptidoglycan/xylan/chitin deacetylase (PgdA/CDA1 family)
LFCWRLAMEGKLLTNFIWRLIIYKMRDFSPRDISKTSGAATGYVKVDTCLVLQFHRVSSLCFDPLQLAVEPYNFEKQIEYLAQNYNVISIDRMKHHLENSQPFKDKTILLTFDGGYKDVLYTAKQVLQKYEVPAVVFTSTARIIEGGRFWWKELEDFLIANDFGGQLELEIDYTLREWPLKTQLDRFRAYEELYSILSDKTPSEQREIIGQITGSLDLRAEEFDNYGTMSAQELRKIEEGGLITIGGHTHSYVKLSSLPKCEQAVEIWKNKKVLEEITEHDIEYFSYPFSCGSGYTTETIDILENNGFSLACSGSYGTVSVAGQTGRYELPRVKVGNWNVFTFYRFLRRFFD